jgi:aspartate/methionine/tyrosine aminotransferase
MTALETTQRYASPPSIEVMHTAIGALRREYADRERDDPQADAAPIRAMARMVSALEAECIARGYDAQVVREAITNRTIGDVNPRLIVEHDAMYDYRSLADDLGIAFPQENINGYIASGETYLALCQRMMDHDRALFARGWDLHMYDLAGIGNPLLREAIAHDQRTIWGLSFTPEQIFLSTGSLDGLDKSLRGLRATRWDGPPGSTSLLFPTPSFALPEWQAKTFGINVVRVPTSPAHNYKLTPDELLATLRAHPEARGIYLILSNNPSAYSYSPHELRSLFAIVASHPELMVLADMAYTGTGRMEDEQARVRAFADMGILPQTLLCWSLSKVYTMTGDRFGWVSVGDPSLAPQLRISWMNSSATLPAEWQLRFMAFYEHVQRSPAIRDKVSALYALRRRALIHQLQTLNDEHHLFRRINLDDGGTIYTWSQLSEGQDVFSVFSRTGIAGVAGSAFGYTNDHLRFSVGIEPVPGWEQFAAGIKGKSDEKTALGQ